MTIKRITLSLPEEMHTALLEMGRASCRSTANQVVWIVNNYLTTVQSGSHAVTPTVIDPVPRPSRLSAARRARLTPEAADYLEAHPEIDLGPEVDEDECPI
jgi:hypothetical protein